MSDWLILVITGGIATILFVYSRTLRPRRHQVTKPLDDRPESERDDGPEREASRHKHMTAWEPASQQQDRDAPEQNPPDRPAG